MKAVNKLAEAVCGFRHLEGYRVADELYELAEEATYKTLKIPGEDYQKFKEHTNNMFRLEEDKKAYRDFVEPIAGDKYL